MLLRTRNGPFLGCSQSRGSSTAQLVDRMWWLIRRDFKSDPDLPNIPNLNTRFGPESRFPLRNRYPLRDKRRRRQAPRQPLPVRRPLRGLAQAPSQPGTGNSSSAATCRVPEAGFTNATFPCVPSGIKSKAGSRRTFWSASWPTSLWKTLEQWQARANLGNSPRTAHHPRRDGRIQSTTVALPLAEEPGRELRIRCRRPPRASSGRPPRPPRPGAPQPLHNLPPNVKCGGDFEKKCPIFLNRTPLTAEVGLGYKFLCLKLFGDAHPSISVPPTVKILVALSAPSAARAPLSGLVRRL